ncbi:hypothetical protein L1987_67679 [Smallanthus sonchifolius]|uniref:Uncharacterized protein n=1 Tax=Smallanthus sonchifolius TaxID=185202 RepID=A0ACB9B4Z5_9ASTR|nr:hypothetical protein L1987_67679 [Smallanthus sonchifolius]
MVFPSRCLSILAIQEKGPPLSIENFFTANSDFDSEYIPNINASSLRVFSFAVLKEATNNFHESSKIGEGGFGNVHMGTIKSKEPPFDNIRVAVKRGKRGQNGYRQWETEVNILGKIMHQNLVKLIGYCDDQNGNESNWYLVYEYMPKGSVDDHLSPNSHTPLTWGIRLKIALDTAIGLTYLHEGLGGGRKIIFRDLKPSNVLLDENWNAKLSDFGFAREGPLDGRTHVSTSVVGTKGYAAPEYVQTGRLTFKVDVWSYGIFLAELVTGRRPVAQRNSEINPQHMWWGCCCCAGAGKSKLVVDLRLAGTYSDNSMQKICSIVDQCLVKDPKKRPKMSEVLQMVRDAMP